MESTAEGPAASADAPGPDKQKQLRLHSNTKRAAVVRTLIERGEQGLNCFESVRLCHDYVLRSTISDLQRGYGLTIRRKLERVPGHNNSTVEVMRYWFDEAARRQASGLLQHNTHGS
jgi:hypothetical protein